MNMLTKPLFMIILCHATKLFQTKHLRCILSSSSMNIDTSLYWWLEKLISYVGEVICSMYLNFQCVLCLQCSCVHLYISREQKKGKESDCSKSSKEQILFVPKRWHSPGWHLSSVTRKNWLNSSAYIYFILL